MVAQNGRTSSTTCSRKTPRRSPSGARSAASSPGMVSAGMIGMAVLMAWSHWRDYHRLSSNFRVKARMTDLLGIGALARSADLPVATVRFYSNQGLLPPATVSRAGYRYYSEADRVRLDLIKRL